MGYRGKVDEQAEARRLRADGWTLLEIAEKLHVSKSSVSLWVRDVELPVRRPRRTGARRRQPNALQRRKQAEIDELDRLGIARLGTLNRQAFLAAGAALYAGEGAKRDGSVRFANSDPAMITFLLSWLREFFDIDEGRLRLSLYLHEGLDLGAAQAFWSARTRIPLTQFRKPYRATRDVGIRHNKHPYGCPAVVYDCSRTHRAVMGLVRGLLSCEVGVPG